MEAEWNVMGDFGSNDNANDGDVPNDEGNVRGQSGRLGALGISACAGSAEPVTARTDNGAVC